MIKYLKLKNNHKINILRALKYTVRIILIVQAITVWCSEILVLKECLYSQKDFYQNPLLYNNFQKFGPNMPPQEIFPKLNNCIILIIIQTWSPKIKYNNQYKNHKNIYSYNKNPNKKKNTNSHKKKSKINHFRILHIIYN